MRWRQDAALQQQRSVWREHDANLAKAWLAQEEAHQLIVLPDFDASFFEDPEFPETENRVITLD
jgi:predicted amidohydrolase